MEIALCAGYTPWEGKRFRKAEGAKGFSPLNSRTRLNCFSSGGNWHRRENTRSMCRSVFLAAGGEEDRRDKNNDDDWNHKEWRSDVHGAGSLLFPD
jgi:hypothetical protein